MAFVGRLGVVALAAAGILACASPAERLAEARRDLRGLLDEAYASYGGGPIAGDARARDGEEGRSVAARFLGEADRALFEQHCLAYGRGERPFSLSAKLDAWVKEHESTCREASELALRIQELERKVEAR